MKKATFLAILSTAVVCFLFWLIITGQIVALVKGEPSGQILIAGAIVCIGVALFSAKFFIHKNPLHLWNPVKLVWLAAYCFGVFMCELFKANVDVAKRALSRKIEVNPGIVKVPVKLESEYGRSMLANSITLTPGTITMDTVEEKGRLYYYIHWIDVASTNPEEAGEAIKGKLEKWIGRIWK